MRGWNVLKKILKLLAQQSIPAMLDHNAVWNLQYNSQLSEFTLVGRHVTWCGDVNYRQTNVLSFTHEFKQRPTTRPGVYGMNDVSFG